MFNSRLVEPKRFALLLYLARTGGRALQCDIAAELGITTRNVLAYHVGMLAEARLVRVRRMFTEGNAGTKWIYLTDEGRQVLAIMRDALNAVINDPEVALAS